MQGSLSTRVEETSWVITSYLAANAIAIPATAWRRGALGRRQLFLIRTMAMMYRDTVGQAQVLSYADVRVVLVVLFVAIPFILELMRRVRAGQTGPRAAQPRSRLDPGSEAGSE